jgi:hypothetical protein
MTRQLKSWFAGTAAALLVTVAAVPAHAIPVCADPPRELCGGRIFAEPERSITFVQHDDGEFEAGVLALAEEYPRYVKVRTFSDILGRKTVSVDGRQIWMIEITDFKAPERNKVPVAVSLSVHGVERAGLEGGVRYAEDLARWAADDPDHKLRNGTEKDSVAIPVSKALKGVHLYLTNINPDGWAAGDLANGGLYDRGNGNGVDLNREFPTLGWTQRAYTPLSEPESMAWDRMARNIDPVVASDLHGELTSANDAFADIMYPAGQWDPLEQAREERLARHMASNITRYFDEQGVEIAQVTGIAGMRPAEYATAYDVVGYDDSGFMGDYFTQNFDAVEVDLEHFFSHLVPNSLWIGSHEDAHVAAVRGEIETMMVEALVYEDVSVTLDLGKTGYLFNSEVVASADGYGGPRPPAKVDPEPYRATRMRYFTDLSRYSTVPLQKVRASELGSGLRGLDSLVIAGDAKVDAGSLRALKGFVRSGRNLLLTDDALKLLPKLGVVKANTIRKNVYNAGHIDIETFDDPYLKGVHSTASQTYYEVPLGYSVDQDTAPHFTVARAAWEKAGGKTLAYITDEARVGLGRTKVGKGTIGIIGALLPMPTEEYDHFFGLADYAVTVAGGQILNNMLAFGRR